MMVRMGQWSKFEDIESGRMLEVDFCLDQNGEVSQTDIKKMAEQLQAVKVE